jgi:hypothetical protein
MQRTALCAREIRAFLKRSFGSTAFPISNAPPLKRKTLGRSSNTALSDHILPIIDSIELLF